MAGWLRYAVVVSKLIPTTGITLLDAVGADKFYSLLVIMTIPVTVVAAYLNWLGMKFFRHN